MHLLFLLAPIFIVLALVRLVTLPFRMGRRYRSYYGYGYDRGYNPYRYGRLGFGGWGTIVALVALDRLFGGRRY
jgi:hypothetical protein